MSERPAIVQAQEHSRFGGSRLHVLLAIASHAYPNGSGSYPGMERIAQLARVSERQCQRIIKELAEAGELVVHRKAAPRGLNLYELGPSVLDSGHIAPPADDAQVSPLPDIQVSGHDDAQVSGPHDIWTSGSGVRDTPPRHLESATRQIEPPNTTPGAVQHDTWVSPEPSIAIQKPSTGASPPHTPAHDGGGDLEPDVSLAVAASELRCHGLEPDDYPDDLLPVAVKVAGEFGEGRAALVGALAYAAALDTGVGARRAMHDGQQAAEEAREGVTG